MFKKLASIAIIASSVLLTGCMEIISSGEVGVRVNASKEVQGTELMPGSWNQTFLGSVLTFPVRDIAVNLENKTPLTSDNSALADFDLTIVYNINPTSVAELYTKKSKSFHAFDEKSRDTYLMYNYMVTLTNNASYKAVRQYKALEVADNRQKIEAEIRELVTQQLREEKLDTSVTINVVQVRNVAPNADILKAATDFVRSSNELKIKDNEVLIARKEAERQQILSQNSEKSIAYMDAQSRALMAQAIAAGKVNTLIVPSTFTALGTMK